MFVEDSETDSLQWRGLPLLFCACHWCNKQRVLRCVLLHRGAPEADVLSRETQILSANNSNTKEGDDRTSNASERGHFDSQNQTETSADFSIRTHSKALSTLLFMATTTKNKHVSIFPRNGNNVGQMLRLNQSWKHRYALKVQFQTLHIPVREWVYFVSDSGWISCNIHDKLPWVSCLLFFFWVLSVKREHPYIRPRVFSNVICSNCPPCWSNHVRKKPRLQFLTSEAEKDDQ